MKPSPKFNIVVLVFAFALSFFYFSTVKAHDEMSDSDAHQYEEGIGGEDVNQIKGEIARLEQEIKRLQQEQEQYRGSISQTQAKAKTLQNQIANLNSQIKYLENQVRLTSVNIDKTQVEIVETAGSITETQKRIEAQKRSISQSILFIARQDDENLLMSLLKNTNLSDFIRQVDYANSVNENLVGLIHELDHDRTQLEGEKDQLESKKTELETLKQRQAHEIAATTSTKAETNSLLKATKGQEAEYQKMLTKSEEFERQMNLQIFKLEDALRQAVDPNSLPSVRKGILDWPVTGRISQNYGCIESAFARRYYSTCNDGKGGFHNGLDIAASYGTPLTAADDGVVVAVGNAPYAYGIWAAVEHANGLVTGYTHMAVRSVGVGQVLKRGDMVGKMGSSGLSTGNHVHFLLYAPKTFRTQASSISGTLPIGATLNPREYLP